MERRKETTERRSGSTECQRGGEFRCGECDPCWFTLQQIWDETWQEAEQLCG